MVSFSFEFIWRSNCDIYPHRFVLGLVNCSCQHTECHLLRKSPISKCHTTTHRIMMCICQNSVLQVQSIWSEFVSFHRRLNKNNISSIYAQCNGFHCKWITYLCTLPLRETFQSQRFSLYFHNLLDNSVRPSRGGCNFSIPSIACLKSRIRNFLTFRKNCDCVPIGWCNLNFVSIKMSKIRCLN